MSPAIKTVGVFIDAENLPARAAEQVMATASSFGRIIERRVYGNFASQSLRPWMDAVPRHALSVQTTPLHPSGKNGTDILLATDVTELMCSGEIEVFVIASSDSDFSALVLRLRMRGHRVIGIGRETTAEAFKQSFDEYHEVEVMPPAAPAHAQAKLLPMRHAGIGPYVTEALDGLKAVSGEWVDVARLSTVIRQQHPTFSPKTFGSAKFSTVLKNCGFLELRMSAGAGMQVRLAKQSGMPRQEVG